MPISYPSAFACLFKCDLCHTLLTYSNEKVFDCFCSSYHFSHLSLYLVPVVVHCLDLFSSSSRDLGSTPRLPKPWSSLDKGESLACQINSSFNKKIGCFEKQSFKFHLKTA